MSVGILDSQKESESIVIELENRKPQAVETAKNLESKWSSQSKNACSSARAFGEFVGAELTKGALFTAGLKTLQATASNDKRIQIISTAETTFHDILATWIAWQAFAYAQRDDFGQIEVEDLHTTRFEILQNQISDLSDQRDKMVPLLKAIKDTNAGSDVQALLVAEISYGQDIARLSDMISRQMSAMTNAGLPPKTNEVRSALAAFMEADLDQIGLGRNLTRQGDRVVFILLRNL
ncbi:hypothetical protein DER46DRAFT_569955 [Fusarium sp. MPI-SDFR-AT-0072]|nr:hypothetical protein DER46DRAFT_569955 [Fusarium sp. MPI-SDFR-AT-0072]